MKKFTATHLLFLVLGLAFLYLPILVLILYSFNASKLVTVWGGFSTHWYGALFKNAPLLEAFWLSIKIAFISATLATILGTLSALTLTRFGRSWSRTLLSGLVAAPMVMPEVIIGLSLLLLFVGLNIERGFWTVIIAHVTLTTCFATIVVQSRLATFDKSLEEAAQDLGAPPWRVFHLVTLPIIAPAIAAGWMLAFTLSLDDLVIASFTTGPGATTLPMRLYSAVRLGVTPEINAASTLLIALVSVVVVGASLLLKHQDFKK